ncbi:MULTISPECIES: beta-aspartyl-peptidase [Pseudoalteromonas]|uniref:Isoaspartyl dipeptidase n=1 Tax=Pseudoalteromonas maricaloris TaxID=184924 RepID=A0A8I2KR66_9GAMM|nr:MULTISPECIES: beta-aspartyl-peptidase [Pseudoalteromonas]KID38743.1 isoaspartyl dipeptidase [Pseudoalteromonas flavipulchra NCIMB 2033 = ATCC BAA-314]MBD0783500.1 beta-aspartyl-peptidase [Pseudoalteromonas flavipulchra]MBE0375195.1 beta-aspartyl-dipeptidase (metallo-type) [Pseudoalteromonas flavipulchra NCIMB 2033 = ATCC BAA-314]NLR22673.1 beta-aspartyl-peptidase [Pseudoalteromonas maricaloris]RZG13090.1 beta-aspartyl-peptidase [Pseudoalteromonas sp. CO342X]
MLTLIKNVELFTPKKLGKRDVLFAGKTILAIEEDIEINSNLEFAIVDGQGFILAPGFVDSLVHFSGGGGEAGFASRTPQMNLTDATLYGITTVIGALGTDDVSRTHTDLVAKAKGLKQEGLNAFCHTGSYHLPIKTLGHSIRHDIMYIDEIIGVGEVAIADHRGTQPSVKELTTIAAEARTAGLLSGKRGTVSIHVGTGVEHLQLLHEVALSSEIPLSQFYPTHMNRNAELLTAGIAFCKAGGTIDFTTSTTEYDLANGELAAAEALAYCLDKGVNSQQLTMSSDGHASLPIYNEQNHLVGFEVGSESSLLGAFQQAVQQFNVPLDLALQSITSNPARILGLNKGEISVGRDADLVLLDANTLTPHSVWCNGQKMVESHKPLVSGFFS